MRRRSMTLLLLLILTTAAGWAQTAPYTRTVIVPSNSLPAINGAALLSALAGLSPAPSATNRWLIKLEPGRYNVGVTPVVLQPYVDLEGSGIIETEIEGAFDPFPSLLGGLVRGASNSELRQLTINCTSKKEITSCQALSVENANPRLTHVRILSQGSGTGAHWGIRTSNSHPVLDDVEILVSSATSGNNYGIVYGGESTVNIVRSNIQARNASFDNMAIVLKQFPNPSTMYDTILEAVGGSRAHGISFLDAQPTQPLLLTNVVITASGASTQSAGIGEINGGSPIVRMWGGRIYGATDGVDLGFFGSVDLSHTDVEAPGFIAAAGDVVITFGRLQGGGTVEGASSETCHAVVSGSTFFVSGCP